MKMILTNMLDAFVFKDMNVYVYKDMEELRTCTKCNKTMELQYFSMNFKGEPYKRCQTCINKISVRRQKPEVKEYAKQYYEENKEHKKQMSKQWKQNNKDRLNEKAVCVICGSETNRCNTSRHKHSTKCKEALKLNMNSHI